MRRGRRSSGNGLTTPPDDPVPEGDAPADPRDALIAQLRADLDDARSEVRVLEAAYMRDLQNATKALRALRLPS